MALLDSGIIWVENYDYCASNEQLFKVKHSKKDYTFMIDIRIPISYRTIIICVQISISNPVHALLAHIRAYVHSQWQCQNNESRSVVIQNANTM